MKITAGDGTVGWGQSVPAPRWSYETLETVNTTIRLHLAPELIGRDPSDLEGIRAVMEHAIAPSFSTGQPICKAGIDLALARPERQAPQAAGRLGLESARAQPDHALLDTQSARPERG